MEKNKPYKLVGSRLARLRGEITQKAFAKKIGISAWAYCRFETGERIPSMKMIYKLAEMHKVSVDWIVTGEHPPRNTANIEGKIRRAVLSLYGNKCMRCMIWHDSKGHFLEIVPLNPSAGYSEKNLNNLLCLCPNCKKIFDMGILPLNILIWERDRRLGLLAAKKKE